MCKQNDNKVGGGLEIGESNIGSVREKRNQGKGYKLGLFISTSYAKAKLAVAGRRWHGVTEVVAVWLFASWIPDIFVGKKSLKILFTILPLAE